MAQDDDKIAHPGSLGSLDKIALTQADGHTTHQPGVPGPPGDHQGDGGIAHAAAEGGRDRHCQQEGGEGQEHIGDPHDDLIQPAPFIAGDGTQRSSDQNSKEYHPDRNDQCRARPDDHPAEHVSAKPVRAQRMRQRRRQHPLVDIGLAGTFSWGRGNLVGKDRNQNEQDNDNGTGQGKRVAGDHAQHMAEGAGALDFRFNGEDGDSCHIYLRLIRGSIQA